VGLYALLPARGRQGQGGVSEQRWWMVREGEVPLWWLGRVQSAAIGFAVGVMFEVLLIVFCLWSGKL
jgi:hypothetical protein